MAAYYNAWSNHYFNGWNQTTKYELIGWHKEARATTVTKWNSSIPATNWICWSLSLQLLFALQLQLLLLSLCLVEWIWSFHFVLYQKNVFPLICKFENSPTKQQILLIILQVVMEVGGCLAPGRNDQLQLIFQQIYINLFLASLLGATWMWAPSAINYDMHSPQWEMLGRAPFFMCNEGALPRPWAFLITDWPRPGKYALNMFFSSYLYLPPLSSITSSRACGIITTLTICLFIL